VNYINTSETKLHAGNAAAPAGYSLHSGRSLAPLVRVLPCGSLFRVKWPDTGLSELANLTRCKAAAREWAEQTFLTEHRKMSGARRLKSLNNFWWASSYIAPFEPAAGTAP
jgi:hypothetical protein